jgi:hypothetical protein
MVGCAFVVWDFNLSSKQNSQPKMVVEPLLPIEAELVPKDGPEIHIFNTIEDVMESCPEERYAALSPVLPSVEEISELYACVY